jgi:hypothetical protein
MARRAASPVKRQKERVRHWTRQGGDHAIDLRERKGGETPLGDVGFTACRLFQVTEHEDVLIVQRRRGCGVVEASSDHQPLVDDHQLVMHLSYAGSRPVLEERETGRLQGLGRSPSLGALSPVEQAPHAGHARDEAEHGVVDT